MMQAKWNNHRQNLLLVVSQGHILLLNRLDETEHVQRLCILAIHRFHQRLNKLGANSLSLWSQRVSAPTFRRERRANQSARFRDSLHGGHCDWFHPTLDFQRVSILHAFCFRVLSLSHFLNLHDNAFQRSQYLADNRIIDADRRVSEEDRIQILQGHLFFAQLNSRHP